MSSERAKKASMSAMMSIAGSASSRLCMTTTGTPRSATTRAMSGSRCRPQTSLTMVAPWSSAQAATLAFMVSIETGTPSSTTAGRTGCEPRQFLLERYRLHAAIGAGRFRADVDDVGAFRDHAPRLGDGALRIDEAAAVGEGVRRDVEDAHDERAVERRAGREAVRAPSARRCPLPKLTGGPCS